MSARWLHGKAVSYYLGRTKLFPVFQEGFRPCSLYSVNPPIGPIINVDLKAAKWTLKAVTTRYSL